jgi:hypothetical protein
MFVLLCSVLHALPLSYFISEEPETWSGVSPSFYEGTYQSEKALVDFPIIPLWPFALRFDQDLMISLVDDGPWGMIEVANIHTEEGESLWFTLDSRLDGRQYVGLPEHPLSESLGALFPLPTYESKLKVEETATDFVVSYMRGTDPIQFSMKRSSENIPPKARSGHAMNHAQQSLMAVLDIFSLKLQPVVWLDNPRSVQHILWQPISGLMRQTVGGLRKGSWIQSATEIRTQKTSTTTHETDICIAERSARFCFAKHNEELQLHKIDLFQPLHRDQIAQIILSPALPDLRFIPSEPSCSQLVILFQEQQYLNGSLCVHPRPTGAVLSFQAEKPSWVMHRPMLTEVFIDVEHKQVFGNSLMLTPGASSTHHTNIKKSPIVDISIPTHLIWTEKGLLPSGQAHSDKGTVMEMVLPLVPKEGLLVGRIEVDIQTEHPFLLRAISHDLPALVEMEIHCFSQGNKTIVEVRVAPEKKHLVGGWMEITIGDISTEDPIQSMHITASKGGGGLSDTGDIHFLNGFRISSKKRLSNFSLAVSTGFEAVESGLRIEKSIFWIE